LRVTSKAGALPRPRFVSPVPVGSNVRGRFRPAKIDRSRSGEVTLHWSVTVEIEGAAKPAPPPTGSPGNSCDAIEAFL
jgi:acyl dehydratase